MSVTLDEFLERDDIEVIYPTDSFVYAVHARYVGPRAGQFGVTNEHMVAMMLHNSDQDAAWILMIPQEMVRPIASDMVETYEEIIAEQDEAAGERE